MFVAVAILVDESQIMFICSSAPVAYTNLCFSFSVLRVVRVQKE